jgi:HSP20 family protein
MAYYLSTYRPTTGLRNVVERMFADDFMAHPSLGRMRVHLPLNVEMQDEVIVVTALVPGLESDDVKIEIIENTISIRGELKSVDGEASYLLREIPSGEFIRTIRLPTELDAEKAEAEIAHGVLSLRVPKAENARPKTIEVKAK